MSILVCGAGGFIGGHVVKDFLNKVKKLGQLILKCSSLVSAS